MDNEEKPIILLPETTSSKIETIDIELQEITSIVSENIEQTLQHSLKNYNTRQLLHISLLI